MSTVTLQEKIRALPEYRRGDKLRPGCVASSLSRTNAVIQAKTAKAALKEMAASGEIKASGDWYYRPMPARAWLAKAWRKRSDCALGIVGSSI